MRTTASRSKALLRPRLSAVLLIALGLALGGFAGLGTTRALLSHTASPDPGIITAGDLSVTLANLTWKQTTTGRPDPQSGNTAASLAAFVAQPGDTVEIAQTIDVVLTGDNLSADLTVDWQTSFAPPPNVSGTYVVTDSFATQVAPDLGPSGVGSSVRIPDLGPDLAKRTYVVVATISFSHAAVYVDPTLPPTTATQPTAQVPGLHITLTQTRPGEVSAP